MGCNCMKSPKADDEVAPTPRVIPNALGSQVSRPPVTKSSVPQKNVAGTSGVKLAIDGGGVEATRLSTPLAAEVVQGGGGAPKGLLNLAAMNVTDREEVEATNPSIARAADTSSKNETSGKTTPDPPVTGPTNETSKIKTGSSTVMQLATGTRIAEQLTPPKSPQHEPLNLWKSAYDELRKTECRLVDDLEAVIKADASLSTETDLKDQIALVVKFQKDRMESKQWSFPWFGKTIKVREVVGNIFSMLDKSSDLISMGMNYAPIYVSIPWSAVACLLPLMMSDAEEHQEALEGLERVTKIIWCYAAADKDLLEDPTTRDSYSKVLLPLYIELLKYNCTAAQYFGRKTLKRILKNTTGSTSWSDNSAKIVVQDDHCRRAIQLFGFGRLQHNLEKQRSALEQIIKSASSSRMEKRDILSWMSTVPYGADHDNVRENLGKTYQSSGQWIFKHPKFQEWQHSNSGVFVLRGTAGTGKSSLTSIIIQDLLDCPNGYLAYFYCSRKEKTTQRNDTTMIVRTLVKALSVSGHPAFGSFSENYRNSETQRAGGCQLQLQSCLLLLSESVDKNPSKSVILIIDAIDECAQPASLLAALKAIRGSKAQARNIRIFISSRDGPDVEVHFPDMVEVDIAENNRDDIRSYLATEIPHRRTLDRDSIMTNSQAQELHNVLLEYANGMFQWVVLEIEIFLSQIDDAKIALEETIDEKIETLKASKLEPIEQLDEAYDQIYAAAIGRNDPNRHVIVNNALQWLLCSYRDLKIEELLVAVSVKRDGTKYRNLKERRLKNLLSNFMIEGPSGEVRLAHLTIRPYLEKRTINGQFVFEFSNINLTAALTCLHVLQSPGTIYDHLPDDHEAGIENSNSLDVKELKAYASFYWSLHSRAASKSEHRPEELQNLLESMYGSLQRDSSDASTWTPFHDAIERGQNEAMEYLIASNFSMDQQDGLGNTPLHEAVQYNNLTAVQLLLRGGAAIQIKNNNGNAPLHLAAFTSDYGIVHQLLREEASPSELNFVGQAPIHIAVLHGRKEAIRAFTSVSVDIDFKDSLGNSPLHYAALTNQQDIALMLIQAGCAMNPQNEDDNSPLHVATKAALEAMSTLLLRNGAKVDTRNKEGQTPIDPNFLIGLPSLVTKSLLEALAIEEINIPKALPEYALDVETSGLCSKCANFSFWLSTATQSMYHEHHTSYAALQQSAAQGCKLCNVISTSILADTGDLPTRQGPTDVAVRMLLSKYRKDGNPQDLLIVRMGSEIVTRLELLLAKVDQEAVGGDEGADILSGRPGAKGPYMETCSLLIQQWLVECTSQHSQCAATSASLPTRLLNIGQGILPRLEHTSEDQEAHYIWLSYNWGGDIPLKTTCANVKSYMQGIPFDYLPRMFLDAIDLARRLGISYLYIDAFCILQDDMQDVQREIPKLPEYAAGAICTFSAISPNPSAGLFQKRGDGDILLSLELISATHQRSSDSGYIQIRRPLRTLEENLPDSISSRAWRIQEIVLSPRIVFFHHDQVFWNCNTCLRSEGSLATQQPVLRLSMDATSTPEFDIAQRNHLMPWYSLIELFSETRLTRASDALPALDGIARHVGDTLHFLYVAGVWREDLARGLLWKGRTKYCLTRQSQHIAPSWSCVSLLGRVSYSFARAVSSLSQEDAPRVDDVRVDLQGRSYREIEASKDNYIVLSAMILPLSCGDSLGHLECFFDLVEYEKTFLEGSTQYFCVILARHCLDITDKGSRYIGLLVKISKKIEEEIDLLEATRVGIFVGPPLDTPLDKWVRRPIRIF